MQQIHFEREQMNNYMVIPCTKQLNRMSYGELLLEYACIPGFMNYEIREIDGKQALYYRLQYKTALKHVLDNLNITIELMKAMLHSIVMVLKQTEEYLLDFRFILWKSEAVFVDVASGKLIFTYYPCACEETNSIQSLLMELIPYVEKSNPQAYLYLMGFYNIVTHPECSLEKMEKYIVDKKNMDEKDIYENDEDLCDRMLVEETPMTRGVESVKKRTVGRSTIVIAIIAIANAVVVAFLLFDVWTYQYIWVLVITLFLLFVTLLTYHSENQHDNPDTIMKEYLMEYGEYQRDMDGQKYNQKEKSENLETTILYAETTDIVKEEGPKELFLKSMYPKEYGDLVLNQHNIVLGCLEARCDYVLKKKGISRMHAKLIKKEDGLFLMDLNATNGTYLNEEQLVTGKEYLLEEGDIISLAKVATFVVVERDSAY